MWTWPFREYERKKKHARRPPPGVFSWGRVGAECYVIQQEPNGLERKVVLPAFSPRLEV
jgi:hypothetical protein